MSSARCRPRLPPLDNVAWGDEDGSSADEWRVEDASGDEEMSSDSDAEDAWYEEGASSDEEMMSDDEEMLIDGEERRGGRPDRAARNVRNRETNFVSVKTTLNSLCKRGGNFLPGRALPWEEVLADMNKGVLEAYMLANVHVLRLLEAGREIPVLGQEFFKHCLSAVMRLINNTQVEPELRASLNVYNANRAPSPLANGGHINSGWCANAAVEMATATKNALSMNFYKRFKKYIQREYLVDSCRAHWLLRRILRAQPYPPSGTHFDAIIADWRRRIPRGRHNNLSKEPHRLVPLTHLFLTDIEERNEAGRGDPDYRQLRVFSILPTKKGFHSSHMKICTTALWALLKRARIAVPDLGSEEWEETRDLYWRHLFNIQKFETANRQFAGFIVTDGKAVSITMRKDRCPPAPRPQYMERDFTWLWGLDPGRRDLFVATKQNNVTTHCSTKEFYEDARYTKKIKKIRTWQDNNPQVLEAIRNMPTKKTASLETLLVYLRFMTSRMDMLLGFARRKPFRKLRLRSFIFMKKKLREICLNLAPPNQRTVVGFGNWSNYDPGGIIKKTQCGPVQKLKRELERYCVVISIEEYRTSKVHSVCRGELSYQYSEKRCRDGVIRTQKVYSVLHCRNNGCGMTMNRDVNASRNMLDLLIRKLRRQRRPVVFTPRANRLGE